MRVMTFSIYTQGRQRVTQDTTMMLRPEEGGGGRRWKEEEEKENRKERGEARGKKRK